MLKRNEMFSNSITLACNKHSTSQDTMMTSSNGNIFRVTGPLCGEFTGPGEFPTQRPVTRSFDVCFDLRLNKRLSKHSWGWWFETLSWSLWRHHNDIALINHQTISPRFVNAIFNEGRRPNWTQKSWTGGRLFVNNYLSTLFILPVSSPWIEYIITVKTKIPSYINRL